MNTLIKEKPVSKSGLGIAQDNTNAKELGLSYGQYVSSDYGKLLSKDPDAYPVHQDDICIKRDFIITTMNEKPKAMLKIRGRI
ncbi:MAG: hypothetical protein E7309_11410 [Butyrivibrio sp.]|jgi:hypothetical protein|nr:hypothetical protein [Butyrivibrio sp.]